jgi:uncharacterized protein DUF1302
VSVIPTFNRRRDAGRCAILSLAALAFQAIATVAIAEDLDDLLDLPGAASGELQWGGHAEIGLARTYSEPEHWSKMRVRLEGGGSGDIAPSVRGKFSLRADADFAQQMEKDIYSTAVRKDQSNDLLIREAYIDISRGDWDYRLGRQQVVWGEMVGAFIADVVSARDLREFFLPELEAMRIAQWAARAEYYSRDFHAEFLWVPFPSIDDIGKPGAEFYPFDVPRGVRILSERKPSLRPANMNWGTRASLLKNGWDLSAFYYRSTDVKATLYPVGLAAFEPRHDPIRQIGGTLSKDMGESFVFRAEVVHTHGRKFTLFPADPLEQPGIKPSDILNYAIGLDFAEGDSRLNLQLFAQTVLDHDSRMGGEPTEPFMGILANHKLRENLEAEIQVFSGFNRTDYMFRPKLVWRFAPAWRTQTGLDVFGGDSSGVFGRFDSRDRIYVDVRRDF